MYLTHPDLVKRAPMLRTMCDMLREQIIVRHNLNRRESARVLAAVLNSTIIQEQIHQQAQYIVTGEVG